MRLWLIPFFSILVIVSMAQNRRQNQANAVLKKVQIKLESLRQASYRQTREIHYYADNYANLLKADLYIDFTAIGPLNLWFQADEGKSAFIYNGHSTLRLNKEEMTIDSATVATARGMQNNSYLYYSLAMLRNMLPLLITNDSFQKSVTDTVINKKHFYNVQLEAAYTYFQSLGSVEKFTKAGLRHPYYLLVDKTTYLPYQFISKTINGTDDRDFVSLTYTNINTQPEIPSSNSWMYTAYQDKYKPYQPPVKYPLVKPGTVLSNFTLPNYSSKGIDSISLNQYVGKVVLLDFWFKSCGPCMAAMPHYNDLQHQFKKDGFELLTINVEDPVADIQFFYNKFQPVYKMLFNGNKLWTSLGFIGCPSSVLIDKTGKVVQTFFGFNQDMISKKIEALLTKSDSSLADELAIMVVADQKAAGLPFDGMDFSSPKWQAFKDSVFTSHYYRLTNIFTQTGYPGYDKVGKEGSKHFWLLVQHLDKWPEFQQQVLDAMAKQVAASNASSIDFAYPTDRVRLNTGHKQLYGTQAKYNTDSCQAYPKPLENPESVNERRKMMGLPLLEEYLNQLSESHFMMNKSFYEKKGGV